jgi:SAM-dependent methyltransferase
MSLLARIHGGYVHRRRVEVLAGHLAGLMPEGAEVLDVGCGDGMLAAVIKERRPDIGISGIDVLVRAATRIPVRHFDGVTLPCADGSYDGVMFVDVLHHTADPAALLREACRVARRCIIIKDHARDGFLARPTLRFMDWVGNARHGVVLPYNYWRRRQWDEAFSALDLEVSAWQGRLGLYPAWAGWLFERSLHFVAVLEHKRDA